MAADRTGHRVHVDPDYFQFYLRRGEAPWASDAVSETGYGRRLWSDGGFVYVGTHRRFRDDMPVTIAVLDAARPPPTTGGSTSPRCPCRPAPAVEMLQLGFRTTRRSSYPSRPGDLRLR